MAVKRLGKGLGALIPDISNEDDFQQQRLKDIEISKVVPNPFQPRESFDETALEELKQSILENGIIQPITVRAVDSGYQLIAGERRLRAVRDLGLDSIPAYILEVHSDEEMIELSLVENLQRENLNPIDEAKGYQTLITKCKLTQEEVSKKVGKDRSTITNSLRILKLPNPIQESLIQGDITAGHARAFLALTNKSEQIALWKKTVKNKYSVRQVENLVKKKDQPAPKPAKVQKEEHPFYKETEERLREVLATKVRIVANSRGESGRIEIEYYSNDDMERIIELIEKQ
ncbi:MAG: ParB/RepB/Spo0J family partition protein [bacterium]